MTTATASLFHEGDAPVYGPALPEEPPHFIFEVATRKASVKGWQWFASRVVGDAPDAAFIVTGGVPRLLKTGPRKGYPIWDRKAATEVVVTRAEVDAAEAAYEAKTGRCRRCAGSKVHMTKASVEHGVTYSTCWRCKGTGQPTP